MSDSVAASPSASSTVAASPSPSNATQDGKTTPTIDESNKGGQVSPAEKRRLKLKVDGKETEVDQDELERDYSKYKSADKAFKDAARTKKQLNDFMTNLKDNPTQGLRELSKRLGFDLTQVSNEVLRGHLEDEMMSPEEKARREEQAELKKYKDRDQEELTKKEQGEREERKAKRKTEIAGIIGEAMESAKYLAKDESTIADMARFMIHCRENGIEFDAKDVARHIEQRTVSQFSAVVNSMPVGELLRHMPELVGKIREHYLSELKAKRGGVDTSPQPISNNNFSRDDKPIERITPREMQRRSK